MKRLALSLSSLALVAATPAVAQISAADLWAEWQATSAATGQAMTADVAEIENGIALRNFRTVAEQEGATSTGALDEITLTENADGTISVDLSEVYTLTIQFPEGPGEGEPTVTIVLEMRHENLDIQVSGDPGDLTYVYSGDTITLSEASVSNDRGDPPPEIDMTITAAGLETTYQVIRGDDDAFNFDSSGTLASVDGRLEVAPPPPQEGSLKFSFSIGEIESTAAGSLASLSGFSAMTSEGGMPEEFDLEGASTYGRLSMELDFQEGSDTFDMLYSNGGGQMGFDLSDLAVGYEIAAEGVSARVSGSEIPFPVELAVASSEIAFDFPLAPGDAPSDASVRVAYQGLTAGEQLWSIFDPTQQIPRDPATLVFDANAQVQLAMSLLDPAMIEMEAPPGELRSVTLNEINLSVGGAELVGSGDLAFVEGQVVPQPTGSVDMALSGGNALLDRLMSAGLIQNEQAAMARGVAGMFARPGAAPDTLETTIEFLEGGAVTANGIPLQQ